MGRDRIVIATLLVLFGACSDPATTDNNNNKCTGKCDGENNANNFTLDLEGRNDVVAEYLRASANEDGTIEGDYSTFLEGVGNVMGCDESTEQTFVILMSNRDFFPRNMVTRCSEDPSKASEFFLSTQSDFGNREDINPRDFKMAAWDAGARKYNTYDVKDDGTGEGPLYADVEPELCATCHTETMQPGAVEFEFVPIMNELTNPWTLWNAEPDFESHQFDDTIDPTISDAEVYTAMTSDGKLGPAADFEIITRAAIDRTINARLRKRRNDPNLDDAFNLLYPMFCEESANYASESHDAGTVSTAIIIDDSIRALYLQIRATDWPYDWLNDGRIRLRSVEEGETPINVMPVRGESTLQVEIGLASRGVLTPEQVLALRSIDWKKPMFSEFRCDLYHEGKARIEAGTDINLEDYRNVSALLPAVFEEMMYYDTGEELVSLIPPEGGMYDVPDVNDDAFIDAWVNGDLSAYATDIDTFAQGLETYFDEVSASPDRVVLEAERERRGCLARATFLTAPMIPNVDCAN